MNPTKNYSMDFSQLKEDKDRREISGDLFITVADVITNEELFGFTFYSQYQKHSEIKDIYNIKQMNVKDYTENLKTHATSIHAGTAEESIWLLSPNVELKANKVRHPLYSLFNESLQDNDAKIKLLNTLNDNFDSWKSQWTQANFAAINGILSNVLNDVSWDDYEILEDISPVIFSLLKRDEFKDTLCGAVKGIKFKNMELDVGNIIQQLANLETLDLGGLDDLKDLSFATCPHNKLKEINLGNSSIETIKGLDNFPNLSNLYLNDTKNLKSIPHTNPQAKPNDSLKMLYLGDSAIEDLSGLGAFSNLEVLNLNDTKNLKTLTFTHFHPKMREIYLVDSGVITINDLGNCTNLEVLDIVKDNSMAYVKLSNIEHISINNPMTKLLKLDLRGARDLTTLTGLNCPNLEELIIYSDKCKTLSIDHPHSKLKVIENWGPKLEEIVGLDNCLNLESLRFTNGRLQNLSVTKIHEHLKDINLSNVYINVSTVQGLLDQSPNLENFIINMGKLSGNNVIAQPNGNKDACSNDLMNEGESQLIRRRVRHLVKKPQNIKLSFKCLYDRLKTIDIVYSGLTEIDGLDNCPNLEKINLQGAKLKELIFESPHVYLRNISVYHGSVGIFKGLDHCLNLKELNLEQTYYSGGLTLDKDNKQLVIKGVRKAQIRGIEHLDESQFR